MWSAPSSWARRTTCRDHCKAIEVDGVSFHDNELQKERDNKKNHILEIIGLPLLRLSTDGHSEKAKIIESLSNAMGHS
ncbi:hypothetical protein DW130_12115 [Bacteroides eggerthii]|nr:hypothetical protein DW130_12115 [Bacteroides eggerthii]